MDELKAFLREYKWRIIGIAAGVVLTTLLLTMGFWRTMLLLVLTALCYFVGRGLDKYGVQGLASAISSLLGKNK